MVHPPPPPDEEALASALADYHRRQAIGDSVWAGAYAERLGALYPEFERLVEVEQTLDETLDPLRVPALPRVFGRFTFTKLLGAGGMGLVYLADDRVLGRQVAVKVLHPGFVQANESTRRDLIKEARNAAHAKHDHIVQIYDAGEIDGQLYYAMEHLEGESLEAKSARGERLDPRRLAEGLLGIADGLSSAVHGRGVIHRDVKPGNIMVTRDAQGREGRFVLLDFGLARRMDGTRLTRTGQAVGSLPYMSPEQLRAERDGVTFSTDIYGLGAVLYEGLTGRPPFATDSREALVRMILSEERPLAPRKIDASIPVELENVVLVALQKRPADRYATAQELREDLQRFLDQKPTRVPVGGLVRAGRWLRAKAVPLASAAAVLVALVVGWSLWSSARPAQLTLQYFVKVGKLKANVMVDGSVRGVAGVDPLRLSLPAGRYAVVAQMDQFGPQELGVSLAPGQEFGLELRFGQPLTPEAERIVREAAEQPQDPIPATSGTRGGATEAPALVVLVPSGEVRRADLARGWVIDLEEWSGGGELVLRRGAEELSRSAFEPNPGPNQSLVCGRFPDAALARVAPDDRLTFAWEPKAGSGDERVEAQVHVVSGDAVAPALERIEGLFASGVFFAARLKVEALFDQGLLSAALSEAREAARAHPRERAAWELLDRLLFRVDPATRFSRELVSHLHQGYPAPPLCSPGP